MTFLRDYLYSLRSLAGAKSRTALTMLGIIIGVMSTLAVSSIGQSAQKLVVDQVSSFGTNLVGVLPGGSSDNGPPAIAFGIVVKTLTVDDAKAMAALPHVLAGTPYVRGTMSVTYRQNSETVPVQGASERLPEVEDVKIASGRFFNEAEASGFGRVAVLGAKVAEDLFHGEDPLGQRVRIKDVTFDVIGVTQKRGGSLFQDQDGAVLVPFSTAQRVLVGIDYAQFARVKVDDAANIPEVKLAIADLLRQRHHIRDKSKDDFSVRSTDQAAGILGNVTGAIKGFLYAVTAISLLVGGINIMNIMYVSVRERTKEIGLRKALGARRGRILLQFLLESATIAFGGGVIGVLLGSGLAVLASAVVNGLGYSWTLIIMPSAVFDSMS
ncbi:MAG: Macrolide export ATP-binding/permease protein MacB, partial [Candidatus Parcubacteria bacterium]